ncbi:hypothetical protein HMPREF9080_01399 [Cardiobacterium valvarum F0432]|uniref:Uncharacterized protein n=1 Tax=Cardiobacterium valvarum F0432 TaxID=797473 RepID=G9ZF46_9GAMM|nr:hypothetical protein HMPREF9080_01399 [Cardiobacterium valvarum F0432]
MKDPARAGSFLSGTVKQRKCWTRSSGVMAVFVASAGGCYEKPRLGGVFCRCLLMGVAA